MGTVKIEFNKEIIAKGWFLICPVYLCKKDKIIARFNLNWLFMLCLESYHAVIWILLNCFGIETEYYPIKITKAYCELTEIQ